MPSVTELATNLELENPGTKEKDEVLTVYIARLKVLYSLAVPLDEASQVELTKLESYADVQDHGAVSGPRMITQVELKEALTKAKPIDESIELFGRAELPGDKNASTISLKPAVINMNQPGQYATSSSKEDWVRNLKGKFAGKEDALITFINQAKAATFEAALVDLKLNEGIEDVAEQYKIKVNEPDEQGRFTFDIMKGDEIVKDPDVLKNVDKYYKGENGINKVANTMDKPAELSEVRRIHFSWKGDALKPAPAPAEDDPALAAADPVRRPGM